MRALLLHPELDFELEARLPPQHEALVEDLGLDDLLQAMAAGDRCLYEVARTVVLAGLREPGAIVHRQRVIAECIERPQVARQLYDLAVAGIDVERDAWRVYTRSPELALSMAIRTLEGLLPVLRELRRLADAEAERSTSDGFRLLFGTLRRELDDAYLRDVETHLRLLRFTDGVSVNGRLGPRNAGAGFTLRRPGRGGWQRLLGRRDRRGYTISVPPRDDPGNEALAELRIRGINLVANAVSQSVDHLISFFRMIRFEVGFYLGALNLRERLTALGEPVCFPDPCSEAGEALTAVSLVDVGLSLRSGRRSVGNDLDADARSLVFITGANQGGKSTLLRAVGTAQVMMQCGLFVGAARFSAAVRDGVFTHFRRREDATMTSGRLDEELKRLSELVDVLGRAPLLLLNESFAATNEREGADIAEGVVRAFREAGAKIVFVTHSYELARRFHAEQRPGCLFLRAERLPDGQRTFRLREGEPLPTSYGQDLYGRIFGTDS
jgi:MutS domain V